jgi:acetolactate synthase-1/2/3 large subunit
VNAVNRLDTRTVSQVIADELSKFGVSDVFCVVGGAIAGLVDVFARDSRFNVHYLLHEQSAGIAAESYASVSGQPCVLLVTSGPGATNAMTPLAAAWTNSSPVIVLAGQVRSVDIQSSGENRQWGSQHIDSISMVKTFTKLAIRIDSDTVQSDFADELAVATNDRPGPIWFEVPSDVQRAQSRDVFVNRKNTAGTELLGSSKFIDLLNEAIITSKKPLLLLGNGCRSELERIREFVEDIGWPTQLTWPALDFIETRHPQYAGRPGSIANWSSNVLMQNADLVLILGARLDWGQVGFRPDNFAAKAKIFRVEIDSQELRRLPRIKVTDARMSIKDFLDSVSNSEIIQNARSQNVSQWKEIVVESMKQFSEFGSSQVMSGISMYELLEEISRCSSAFPTIVSGSSGTCTEQVMQAIAPQHGQRILNSGGLGSMGFGLSGAIGAFYATNKPVLCLESDGSFSMNPQDLNYISKNNLPIRILIMDSGGYKSILLSQKRGELILAGISEDTGLDLLDPVATAQSMGIAGSVIDVNDDWKKSVYNFLQSTDPSLLQVRVNPEEEAAPRVMSKLNSEGKMETAKLDDLWPPLTPEEFSKIMKVRDI